MYDLFKVICECQWEGLSVLQHRQPQVQSLQSPIKGSQLEVAQKDLAW